MSGKKPKKPKELETAPPSDSPPPAGDSEETPPPDTVPAAAPHHEFTEAHGYPSLRRVQPPQE